MATPKELFSGFVKKCRVLTKDSHTIKTPDLFELYRKEGQSFQREGFFNVDTCQSALGKGKNALWTDGTSYCTAMAIRGLNGAFLTHYPGPLPGLPNGDSTTDDNWGGRLDLAHQVDAIQIVLATTPHFYDRTKEEAYASESSSLVAAYFALRALYNYNDDAIANLTTIITGYKGRPWTPYCVLAVNTKRVGFFMGASESEPVPHGQTWRTRRKSFAPERTDINQDDLLEVP